MTKPKRAKRPGSGPFTAMRCVAPTETWKTFRMRRKADSVRIGRRINLEEILTDLLRQYAEGATYFGKRVVPDLTPREPTEH
jgi:hypothetical protein